MKAFEPERGTSFATFVCPRACGAMKDACRRALGGRVVELEEDAALVLPFEDVVVEVEARVVAQREAEAALGRLKPRERFVLEQLATGRASTWEVAEQLGISYNATRDCYRLALRKVLQGRSRRSRAHV